MSRDLIMYHFSRYCVLPIIHSTESAEGQKKMKCPTFKCFWIMKGYISKHYAEMIPRKREKVHKMKN
jgi:hypothetical protein